jgi:hypothetical protein
LLGDIGHPTTFPERSQYRPICARTPGSGRAAVISREQPVAHNGLVVSEEWIAYRLAVMCSDTRGRVATGRVLWDQAVRVALLIDLALRGRLESDIGESWIDTSPTGFPAADKLLADIEAHPDRPITTLFGRADVRINDVLDPGRSRLTRFGRALTVDRGRAEAVRKAVNEVATTGRADTPAAAALAVLAGALNLVTPGERPALLAQAEPVRALLAESANYLDQLIMKLSLIATIPNTSG